LVTEKTIEAEPSKIEASMSLLLDTLHGNFGGPTSPLGFETSGDDSWPVWNRYLTLNGKRAYEVGNVCSTCAFFFERLGGANGSIDPGPGRVEQLAQGLTALDPALINHLGAMMPPRDYSVSLLNLSPQAVTLGSPGDYFVTEQQETWGANGFWNLPHYPKVPYYRLPERRLSPTRRLFEFVIPMYPRSWLKTDRLDEYRRALASNRKPTAVAVSLLDIKQPHDSPDEHWCLAHYIVDGHHKIEAASLEGQSLSLLSFLARGAGASTEAETDELLTALAADR
jgi:hypothetical protein